MRTLGLALAAIPCLALAGIACSRARSTAAPAPSSLVAAERAKDAPSPPASEPAWVQAKPDAPAASAMASPATAEPPPARPADAPARRAVTAPPAAAAAPTAGGVLAGTTGPMGLSSGAGGAGRGADKGALRDDAVYAPAPTTRAWAPAGFEGVKAGEWDDNANYREFQRFLGSTQASYHPVDLRYRRFLVVRDAQGLPIPRCRVRVTDEQQHAASFLTTAGGHALLFPRAEGLTGTKLAAEATCAEGSVRDDFVFANDADGVVDLRLQRARAPIATRTVDVAFVLDTTGSMGEEIDAVTQTIRKVAAQLQSSETRVRIGMVEYKDRTDPFVTKVYPMTQDLQGFAAKVATIQASGGGDTPEDMNAGIHDALTKLDWSSESVARLAFVIADAPPHLDYQGPDYAQDMKTASHRGIQLFTVAASGMDLTGQIVMRQMAQYTGGTNMFVLRGGAGPQSTGGGDPASSCGGTHQNYASGNLHELIVSKIKRELRAIDGDPMRIAGLRTDENVKPCDQRVVWLD